MSTEILNALKIARDNFAGFTSKQEALQPAGANFYSIKKAEAESDATVIFIYGPIGFYGVEAQSLVRDIALIESEEIIVRINSPGGDVFDGIAIYNALRSHPAKIRTRVESLAASMASIIALAGDVVEMEDNSWIMIHKPWSFAYGNEDDMRKMAEILGKITATMVKIYQKNSKLTDEEALAAMAAETWYNAEEALAAGFITQIIEHEALEDDEEDDEAVEKAAYDLSIFQNAPDKIIAAKIIASDEPILTERKLEKLLRDAGHSHAAAKRAVSSYRVNTLRDAEGEQVGREAVEAARKLAETFK